MDPRPSRREILERGAKALGVLAENIHSSKPEDQGAFFDPADDKVYRHPTFYVMPKEAKYI